MSRVTIRDIAEKLNVSHATVSRALSRPTEKLISKATMKRVHDAAQEMGYRPNPAARALVTGRTNVLSLWLWAEGSEDVYQTNVEHVAQTVVGPTDFGLSINLVGTRTVDHAKDFALTPLGVDGILCHEAGPALMAVLGPQQFQTMPVVCIGSYNWIEGLDRVSVDFTEGAMEAMKHLVAPGRKRVAYLVTHLTPRSTDSKMRSYSRNDPRFNAYSSVLSDAGLESEFIECARGRAYAREAVKRHVEQFGHPDAIFCHSDELAMGAYRGLRDLGLRIPDDVALVGCDGLEDTEYLDVPISTIEVPLRTMFDTALSCLSRRIEDRSAPIQHTAFRAKFVVRESSS